MVIHLEIGSSTRIFSISPSMSSCRYLTSHFSHLIWQEMPWERNFVALSMLYEERFGFLWGILLLANDVPRDCFFRAFSSTYHLYCPHLRMTTTENMDVLFRMVYTIYNIGIFNRSVSILVLIIPVNIRQLQLLYGRYNNVEIIPVSLDFWVLLKRWRFHALMHAYEETTYL